MIAFTPTSAAIEDAADTPTGRHSASGAGSSGAFAAYVHYVGMARALRRGDRLPDHATKCENAESPGHEAECVFDTRMHGAVLVRPTGERVAAPSLLDVAFPHLSVAAAGLMSLAVR